MRARPLPPVRRARPQDAAAIAAIYSATLGEGFLRPEQAAANLRTGGDRHALFVASAATGGGSTAVVGAADCGWVRRAELPQAAMAGFEQVPVELLRLAPAARRFGLLENVAVLPPYRGRGLAAALTEARLEWLRQHGVEFVYTFAWHTPAGIAAQPTLERARFRPVRELPDFYLEDGLRNGYSCPWHGAECRCSALLCVRELDPVGVGTAP